MEVNFLNLNKHNTQIILFDQQNLLEGYDSAIGPLGSHCPHFARNFGVIFDRRVRFDKQFGSVVETSFFYLRLLAKIKPYLLRKNFETVLHCFVTSRLNNCNSLFVNLDQTSLQQLQVVQNPAACLLPVKKRCEHITPILASLHWLSVNFLIHFKVLLIVIKCLNGLATSCISELI